MMLPEAESVISDRIDRFTTARGLRFTSLDRLSGVVSHIDYNDIANLADVKEVPLWECEIPGSDDGF